MVIFRILDYVENYSTYDDGNVIFELIAPRINSGEDVALSFEGIPAISSSFVNAAIVRLVEVVSLTEIRQHLMLVNSTRQINELVRKRIDHLSAPN
ncbi:DUF4325 domain-containing protein [Ottowia sp. GY511]|uniref:STAS-like domain-containing protein n=1 Tax=Ottowia flava TaxID=2675430 RepID=A0ABW4KRY4_9BURK|nr:STAS-like domain-containing protein [Ottowia sp. GY511]TXK33606.1 DUF4325 domain-containing protein [Ottowia sp. GY511]